MAGMTVQNVSSPEELQKIFDQKIGMDMDMDKVMQYQTAQAITKFAEGGGGGSGVAGDAMDLRATSPPSSLRAGGPSTASSRCRPRRLRHRPRPAPAPVRPALVALV